jgi:hypothetical protein
MSFVTTCTAGIKVDCIRCNGRRLQGIEEMARCLELVGVGDIKVGEDGAYKRWV